MSALDGAIGALDGIPIIERPLLPEDTILQGDGVIVVQNANRFLMALVGAHEMLKARAWLKAYVAVTRADLGLPS